MQANSIGDEMTDSFIMASPPDPKENQGSVLDAQTLGAQGKDKAFLLLVMSHASNFIPIVANEAAPITQSV